MVAVAEVDGWVLTVVEIGGVVRGRACAAVEGSCRSGISIIGSSSVCEVALSDSADNAEESGGDVDADVDCTVNPPSSGSSRRSSKSEGRFSSSSCELGISPSGRMGRVGVREGGSIDIVRLGVQMCPFRRYR